MAGADAGIVEGGPRRLQHQLSTTDSSSKARPSCLLPLLSLSLYYGGTAGQEGLGASSSTDTGGTEDDICFLPTPLKRVFSMDSLGGDTDGE